MRLRRGRRRPRKIVARSRRSSRDAAYQPAAADLKAFAGTYVSDEIETTLVVEVRDGALVALRRPDSVIPLRPHSRDRFDAGGGIGLITFQRTNGAVTGWA